MTEASFSTDNSAITPFSDSDERFRTLANATFEGILIHLEGIIVDANEQVAKIIGQR
jgi:PAS domain-containing protein